ncbi:MAG: tetratricopeptide repeat protein [Gammaproteobacteria bacterium]|jgi:tetratricopeptide (TPR) repeat protein|nr:tetratricopeptide repeat protein [Gammaproteobacteria bacterium]
MKIFLKRVAAVMVLTSASMNLQAAFSTDSSKDDRLQKPSASTSEAFLEQVRVNSRLQAAEAAYNLSILAANRKDLTLAHSLIEEAIQMNQSNSNYLTFAADIAFLTQQYDKAEVYQIMVLEIARSAPEFDDLQVAMILDQLGAIYVQQEHYEKARSSYQESLQLREKLYGDNHLQVAMSLNRLALLAVRQDQSSVAETLLKKSLDIAREVSGPRHVNTANMLANLADLYQSELRLEEAEALYKEAISIWGDSPVDPLRQATGQNSLGRLFMIQRRFDDARLQFEQVLTLLKQNYTQDHPYVQQAIRNLTELDAARGSNVEKDRIYDELLREFSSRLPKYKEITADNAPLLPEQRILHYSMKPNR